MSTTELQDIRTIWQIFLNSYHKNASAENYEHIWNKWKVRKAQKRKRKIKEEATVTLELKNAITEI